MQQLYETSPETDPVYGLWGLVDQDLAHFSSIPWCNEHLQQPNLTILTPSSRQVKASKLDSLFSRTLSTPETISSFLLLHETPANNSALVTELKLLVTLGSGLNSYPGVCHGGIVATLLDEAVGQLVRVNNARGTLSGNFMTAYLNTTFKRPVPAPGTVLVTARVTQRKGQKLYVESRIWDEHSVSLAKTDTLYMKIIPKV